MSQVELLAEPQGPSWEYINPVSDRERWLAARGKGIGGSDAGVLMRWNAYTGVTPLWREKTGLEARPFEMNRFIEWGNLLEPVILAKYAEEQGVWVLGRDTGGRPVRFPPDSSRPPHYLGDRHPLVRWLNPVVSPVRPYARANIDGYDLGPHGRFIEKALEAKSTGKDNGYKWDLYPPPSYFAQCLHNRQVLRECGLDVPFRIMVLIGGNSFGWLGLREHPEYVKELVEREARFWHCVETVTKPSVRLDFPRVPTPDELDEENEMGYKPPPRERGGQIPPPKTGTHHAVCCALVDRGQHEREFRGESKGTVYKFSVHWLLKSRIPTHDSDGVEIPDTYAGEPYMVSEWFTASIHEKSNFRKVLKALRGRDVTPEEEKAFDAGEWDLSEELVGMNALLTLSHTEKNDRTYANIESYGTLMDGMEPLEVPEKYIDWLPPSMREEDGDDTPDFEEKETVPASAPVDDDEMPF